MRALNERSPMYFPVMITEDEDSARRFERRDQLEFGPSPTPGTWAIRSDWPSTLYLTNGSFATRRHFIGRTTLIIPEHCQSIAWYMQLLFCYIHVI